MNRTKIATGYVLETLLFESACVSALALSSIQLCYAQRQPHNLHRVRIIQVLPTCTIVNALMGVVCLDPRGAYRILPSTVIVGFALVMPIPAILGAAVWLKELNDTVILSTLSRLEAQHSLASPCASIRSMSSVIWHTDRGVPMLCYILILAVVVHCICLRLVCILRQETSPKYQPIIVMCLNSAITALIVSALAIFGVVRLSTDTRVTLTSETRPAPTRYSLNFDVSVIALICAVLRIEALCVLPAHDSKTSSKGKHLV